ncbi:MAG TPA: TetR/AcrR family transcriptional regulator C-terminal domain-containing protein [Chloroflexota bacterium]|nr:TetR/AcrR family transcriptional regulator C-terminal domain-containing protein [Chloroflexota bacterium]
MIVEPKATPARRSRRSQREGGSGRVPLSRELVLARAIEVGDQEGLEAVSFRRLASDMNVTPMALYRYVRDKDDLLDAMSDMIVGRVDLASVAGAPGGWEGKLRVLLDAFRHVLQAYPVAIPLFTRRAGTTPNWVRTIEVGLGILREAGFPMREAVDLLRQINNRLAGLVTLEPVAAPSPSPDLDAVVRQSRAILQALQPVEFPNVIEAAPYLTQCDDPERYYQLGLDLLVDGVRAQLVKFRR